MLGAVFATLGGASATGIAGVDWAYAAAAGAVLGFAGGRSRRVSWLTSALVTLWVAGDSTGQLIAILAISISVFALFKSRQRWAGALVGALLAWALGSLGEGPFHGSTVIFAAAAATPMIFSAALHLPAGRGRILAGVGSLVAGAAALATAIFVLVSLLAVGDVTTGIDHARAGFEHASQGDEAAAAAEFDEASGAFGRARSKVSGFWTLPTRLVPIVGQHARAVQVVTSQGVSLTDTAAAAARAIDPDDVRLIDGGIDLSFIEELAPVLERVEREILRARDRIADADNPWLVSPIADRLAELGAELDAAAPAATTAARAAAEVPRMLGAGQPVDWLVLVTTPAEARGLGGLVGNFVVVRADDGRFEIRDAGRNEDLNRRLLEAAAQLHGPDQYLSRWGAFSPEQFFQDVTLAPDLPSVAGVAADLYEQAAGVEIDGVVVLDPFAVEAILELSGSINAGGIRLSAGNVVQFLLVDQYDLFEGDEIGRVLALNELVTTTFDNFTGGTLPGPRAIAAKIGPVVDSDRLGIWWAAGGGPSVLIDAAGLDGRFPSSEGADLFAVVHQNSGQNKIDVYLERTINYSLTIDGGVASARAVVEFTNRAPATGLPLSVIGSNDQGYPLGTNLALVSVHSALDIVDVIIDGRSVPNRRAVAFGDKTATFTVEVPSMSTVSIEILLTGRLDALSGSGYQLSLPHQPLVNPDTISVVVDIDGTEQVLLDKAVLIEDTVLVASDR